MKVYLGPGAAELSGGMYRVYALLHEYLPQYGVDIVDTVEEADVVHDHIMSYTEISPNKPLVVSSHGLLWDEHDWQSYGWGTNQQLLRSLINADVATAPSDFVARAITRNTLVPVRVVRHGVDTAKWTPGENGGYVLWNKARVDPANDASEVNKLASYAPTVHFKTTFGKNESNVEVIGQQSPGEMLALVRGAAVYFDTPKESGGPCFGVLEALSCGVPVLAWDNGGNAEAIIHKETGYLATPGDYDDLLRGLQYCFQYRERMGHAARQCAISEYEARQSVRGYVQAYEAAIAKQRTPVKVSVIIPSYNLGKFLPNAVRSVKQQDYTDWEIIIVNDASQDNTYSVAEALEATDPRIRAVMNDRNYHVADARNTGVWEARGKYLLPLDADDRLAPGALKRLVGVLDTHRDIQIVGGALELYHESNLNVSGGPHGWPNDTDYEKQVAGYNRLPYCALYRRKVWENIGGYRRRIHTGVEDADFWTRALSYGYKPKLLKETVLLYTIRDKSLRHANQNGAAEWLNWFAWAKDKTFTPAGALGTGPYSVRPNDTPEISVIIPVGPGHTHHIQGSLDSLLAQNYTDWEVIIVNDTGERWFEKGRALTPFVLGTGFAKVIDSFDATRGVAWARNEGIKQSRGRKLVFLDVDDTAQPTMLSSLVGAHSASGGYIYGDWQTVTDEVKRGHAPDWSIAQLLERPLASITGLYEREHLEEVGGFNEQAPGWEDWDMNLRLLEKGICGTRVAVPLIAYHKKLGFQRANDFSQQDNLIQYIKNEHKDLYQRGIEMGCSKCGGKKTVQATVTGVTRAAKNTMDDLVKLVYVGPDSQSRHIKSPNYKNVTYKVNNRKPFVVFVRDVEFFLSHKDYVKLEDAYAMTPQAGDPPVLFSSALRDAPEFQPPPKVGELSELNLKPEVITVLRTRFNTVQDIDIADDSQIMEIKGMGAQRVKVVRRAVDEWKA